MDIGDRPDIAWDSPTGRCKLTLPDSKRMGFAQEYLSACSQLRVFLESGFKSRSPSAALVNYQCTIHWLPGAYLMSSSDKHDITAQVRPEEKTFGSQIFAFKWPIISILLHVPI
ncbi:hypothetical protein CEXT_684011 [Caerostris extrusa]|uniref:Uncharacterized protein n=1 Tax=Caerostris extrusa TaxID=172846 RepID=A0AAV4VKP5_CAEEX|nr:hypothetical protein CEXT_684011 [Caerostris extrusa]